MLRLTLNRISTIIRLESINVALMLITDIQSIRLFIFSPSLALIGIYFFLGNTYPSPKFFIFIIVPLIIMLKKAVKLDFLIVFYVF